MAGDMRQRAEAVELHLVQEIGMIERLRDPEQAHRAQRERIREPHVFRIRGGCGPRVHDPDTA